MILEVIYFTPLGAQTNTEILTFSFPRGLITISEEQNYTNCDCDQHGCFRLSEKIKEVYRDVENRACKAELVRGRKKNYTFSIRRVCSTLVCRRFH